MRVAEILNECYQHLYHESVKDGPVRPMRNYNAEKVKDDKSEESSDY